jgi:ribosome biogenesis GTPase
LLARVLKSSKREFECKLLASGELIVATALGNLLKRDTIVAGDEVKIRQDKDQQYEIYELSERKSLIYRHIMRENKKKIIASNVDLMIIVMSGSLPEYKRGLVDRYLTRAVQWKIEPILVFNKMDEFNQTIDLKFETDRLKVLDMEFFEVSAVNTDHAPLWLNQGMPELKAYIQNKTAIMLGQSGVGKSKLISALSEGKVNLLSRDLGKVGKGAHTTTWAEIVDCHDFLLVDSPGVRSLSVEDLTPKDIKESFFDLDQLATNCKFSDCEHDPGVKGCYLQQLDPDVYENQLILSRLESYHRMRDETAVRPEWEKE